MNKIKSRFPQLLSWVRWKLKRKAITPSPLSNGSTEPASSGAASMMNGSAGSELLVITSLKSLPLVSFIECSCYGDYSSLAIEKREFTDIDKHILQSAWLRLLSEYYLAKNDSQATRYVSIVASMERLKFREWFMSFMSECMKVSYNQDIAEILQKEFPKLKFTPETYLSDLPFIANMEIKNKVQFEVLKKEFEALEQQKSGGKDQTPKEKEHAFYQSVISINTALKGSYAVKELNALEYALLLKSVDEYIDAQTKNKS